MSVIMARERRSLEDRMAEIDLKIEHHKDCIAKLEEKKAAMQEPKVTYKDVVAKAKEAGMTSEQMVKKLGIKG